MLRLFTAPWKRYAVAIVAVAVGTIVARPIQQFAGGRVPFITFFPLLTCVAVITGIGPALLCTLLSAWVVAVLWMEPFGTLALAKSGDILVLFLYLFAGGIISIVGGSLRGARVGRRESEALLKAVIDNTAGIIYMKDRRGVLRLVNQRFADFAGRSSEELVGKTDQEAFGDSSEVRAIRENDERVFKGGRMLQFEEVMPHADGPHVYLSIKVPVVYEGQGVICGFSTDITDRKLAEQALQQSEARFRALSDEAPVPISVSRKGLQLYVNAAYRHCFGLADDAVIVGASVLEQIAPEDHGRIMENVRRRYANEAVDEPYQFIGLRQDGAKITIEIRAAQIDLPDGPATIAFLSDVTEQQRATNAIAEREARFRSTADSVPVHIWMADHLGQAVFANARYLEYTGLSSENGLQDAWKEIIHPEDREDYLRAYREAAAAQTDYRTEVRLRDRDGAYRWFDIIGRPRFDGGQFAGHVGISLDVTEGKLARDRLRLLADAGALLSRSLDHERSLQELAHLVVPRLADWCAIDMLDDNGTLRRVAVVHPDPKKVELAHDLHRRYPPDSSATTGTWHIIRTGQTACVPVITDEMLYASKRDDAHFKVMKELELRSYVGVPLMVRGRVLGVLTLVYAESGRTYTADDVALAEDLARRAAVAIDNATLFEAERIARNDAERASQLKDEFLATLSHELRTPLNAILGWSQILATENSLNNTEDLAEGLRTIERNARAQTQLIEDLLDMSRIVSGKLRLDLQPVNLGEVVEAAIQSIAPAASAKAIQINSSLDMTATHIAGDASRLQQVIWNLLTNAVKFTPSGGAIDIRLGRNAENIEIAIADTGQGIRPEFLPHLFERFRQADASITRRHGGLGIGLALVKQLVDLHGGSVRVFSDGPDKGATFTVSLPVANAVANRVPENVNGHAIADPMNLTGVSILVVDDEPDARTLVKRMLEERGATVTTAATAKEALELIRTTRPAVLLSDIGMPEHDGYQLISWVRALQPDEGGLTRAAAFTAFARPEDRERALSAGYDAHVIKPAEAPELIRLVADLAGRTDTPCSQIP